GRAEPPGPGRLRSRLRRAPVEARDPARGRDADRAADRGRQAARRRHRARRRGRRRAARGAGVRPFEEAVASELAGLLRGGGAGGLRAGVAARGIHLTVRELVVVRMERGPLDAREVSDAAEAAVRAACRLVRELSAPDELAEIVCRSALEAVRGHGGESARWL